MCLKEKLWPATHLHKYVFFKKNTYSPPFLHLILRNLADFTGGEKDYFTFLFQFCLVS